MSSIDPLAEQMADRIDGSYDCVDRIVLNAHFRLGMSPGGFRTWWRQLFGTDENLNDNHLMRMAGRFSRRLRAFAGRHNIPVIDATSGKNKRMHQLAEFHRPDDPDFSGLFCITISRAPAPVWKVRRFGNGGIDLTRKTAWGNHYSFHIIDAEWGHVTFKLCGHAPFSAQIVLNGHEFIARQLPRWGIDATQAGNCFTETSDAAGLSQHAETSCSESTIGRLWQVCARWISSSCLCFALSTDAQRARDFHYDYSVYQMEVSRNWLFRSACVRDRFFQDLIDRVRRILDVKRLRTVFGRKRRPFKHQGPQPKLEIVVEHPEYDMTIFKIHFGLLTLKIYTKASGVLRLEVITHNTRALGCGRVLRQYAEIASRLRAILERFVGVLAKLEMPWIDSEQIDRLPQPSERGTRRIAGVDLSKPRMRAGLQALLSLAASPQGFTTTDLAEAVNPRQSPTLTVRQAAYDLSKFRAKGFVERIAGTHRYQLCTNRVRQLTALFILRENVIHPLISRHAQLQRGPRPKHQTPIDIQYNRLGREMQKLFKLLHIAA